ncbi:MAG: phosphate ABC transporter permease PstA [Anaerolineales bacterium]|nr:phosphate ABC transporter permease PstA [Anaerolineales bacterium]
MSLYEERVGRVGLSTGNRQSRESVLAAETSNIQKRKKKGRVWRQVFLLATVIGIVALMALLINVFDGVSGYVVLHPKVDPSTLAVDGVPLEEQDKGQLLGLLQQELSSGAYNKLDNEKSMTSRSRSELLALVNQRIVRYSVEESWPLFESIRDRDEIQAYAAEVYPEERLHFVSWLSAEFITRPQSSEPLFAGIRTAIFGSLYTILITVLFAFPMGVGAAIYLEEYADDTFLNRIIQTNINNLAGVPSIIYGILGLAVFVRVLEPLTSGAVFRLIDPTTANGRTILSAGLTLGLLVLPLIIINAQEAIRAVPNSLRQASCGLGATRWQTIWSFILPNAIPGILTGTILAVSRAIGETAPLIVVGASTAISVDPSSPFSKFTTLPIQIYQWTARPQAEWRHLAAAAILVLLALLLTLNATAIVLRNRFKKKY